MRINKFFLVLILSMLSFLWIPSLATGAEFRVDTEQSAEKYEKKMADFHAEDLQLYAKSAVLMDAQNGRILYGKNAVTQMPNASTTKIMTCILALEQGDLESVVTISERAAKMPEVKLNAAKGEQFVLKDLLYALMLESDNDAAVAIAEHVSGSVEDFARQMNEKARRIGCKNTHFVTPNGLDGKDSGGVHRTTAADLCRIMAYCIRNPDFLEIVQTDQKTIINQKGTRSYVLYNHNALRKMIDGIIAGKTGFTGDAGYCYVGAYKKEEEVYTFALLACGWPGNKGYKWEDSKKLIRYGREHYQKRRLDWKREKKEMILALKKAVRLTAGGWEFPKQIAVQMKDVEIQMLLAQDETAEVLYDLPDELEAPQRRGGIIGSAYIMVNDFPVSQIPVYLTEEAEAFDFRWCLRCVSGRL